MSTSTPPLQARRSFGVLWLDSESEGEDNSFALSSFRSGGSSSAGSADSEASGWSPASVEGATGHPRKRPSKRRSISDLSQSARMTPKDLEKRGLGLPWQKPERAICSTLNLHLEEAEQARNFCLLPSPDLKRSHALGPSLLPDSPGPAQMQQRFLSELSRASSATAERESEVSSRPRSSGGSSSSCCSSLCEEFPFALRCSGTTHAMGLNGLVQPPPLPWRLGLPTAAAGGDCAQRDRCKTPARVAVGRSRHVRRRIAKARVAKPGRMSGVARGRMLRAISSPSLRSGGARSARVEVLFLSDTGEALTY